MLGRNSVLVALPALCRRGEAVEDSTAPGAARAHGVQIRVEQPALAGAAARLPHQPPTLPCQLLRPAQPMLQHSAA